MVRYFLWATALLLLVLNLLIFTNVISLDILFNSKQTQASNTENLVITKDESLKEYFVPILMYHYIKDYNNPRDPLGIALSVSPDRFTRQLLALKNEGYTTISLQDLAKGRVKEKSVVLTFDDGYIDHYTNALEILKQFNFTGTFFVVKEFIGDVNYMTQQQIDELAAAGMEIGAHSTSHKNLANLTYQKALEDISYSLEGSDNIFSYPSGKYTAQTVKIVNDLGVFASVTTNIGVATEESDLQLLPRIRVKEYTNVLKRINEEILIAKGELKPSQRSKD